MNNNSIQELENIAVDAAMRFDWQSAVDSNLKMLKIQNDDVSTLLRLGYAYLQLQKYRESHDAYKKVLSFQPQNSIAADYIQKIVLRKKNGKSDETKNVVLDSNMFIQLPGKTKTVSLSQLGQKSMLAKLMVGEEVFPIVRKHHVEIRTSHDEYVGVLPDDVGVRLMYFMENNSVYKVHIQEATLANVIVFIHEADKGKKVEKLVSFPVDIPGSISKVIAHQQAEEDHPTSKDAPGIRKDSEPTDGEDATTAEEEDKEDDKEEDDLEGELIKDLEGDQKPEAEILGIETEEEEEEE